MPPVIVRLAAAAMATRFELVLAGDDEHALRGVGDEAIEEIHLWERRLSRFRPDSVISHLNREAHARPVRVDRPVFDLLRTAAEVAAASGGALDITMGRVMERLGFHETGREGAEEPIECGMSAVELDGASLAVRFTRPGVALDVGALGKGHAIDEALGVLHSGGVGCALVHAGTSSVGALGAPDDLPEGWRIALGPPGAGAPVVVLCNRSMSVSGGHGRTVERAGETLGHIIDPRTLEPVRDGPVLACVVGSVGREVEAWSTALLVLGERPASMPGRLVSVVHRRTGEWVIEGAGAEKLIRRE